MERLPVPAPGLLPAYAGAAGSAPGPSQIQPWYHIRASHSL